jgi:hypothetical protein
MERAAHHLGGIDQIVVLASSFAWLETARPMRFVELTSKTCLVGADTLEREEALVEETGETWNVLQVLDRFALRVQQLLYALDDLAATSQE